MSNTDYIEKINDLRRKINPYSNFSSQTTPNFFKIPKINNIYYLLPPIILLILLIFIKPSFMVIKTINKNKEVRKRINYSKLFMIVLIGGFIVDIILWFYIRK